jgi:hypothetical protein
MKINEIEIFPSRDEFNDDFIYHFQNSEETIIPSTNDILKVNQSSNNIYLGIFNNDKLLSYLTLDDFRNGIWQIGMMSTDRDNRCKGHIKYLIDYAVKKLKLVLSDNRQTEEAKAVYTALIKYPNKVDYFLYNTKTKKKKILKYNNNKIIHNPWDNNEYTVIMMKAKQLDEYAINQEKIRFEHRIRSGLRLDYYGDGFTEFNP